MTTRSDVAIIGAGFGGLAVAHRLARSGIDDAVILERDDGVGGTWRANSYPGAACDVPSHLYSLSFAPNPDWSSAYADQAEILEYVEDCYDRFDVRRKVRTRTTIVCATWSDADSMWRLADQDGNEHEARVLVSAVGMFNTPSVPAIDGLDAFGGTMFHSARWDHSHDLTGERVAVIGTGASAIQVVPAIAERTAHVDVYQRTAPWVMPRRNDPYAPEQRSEFAAQPDVAARHRQDLYDLFELNTIFVDGDPMIGVIERIGRDHIVEAVADPALRARVEPGQALGCQRILVSSDWYPAIQRDDVGLVTDPIERVTADGVRTVDGTDRPADTIVLCTGFRAGDYLCGIDVIGRGGVRLHDRWGDRPSAYHGIAVPGFPNFFMLYGPNTNQGGNSILLMLEAQAQFVGAALEAMGRVEAPSIEVTEEAMTQYRSDLDRDLATTVWTNGCRSYFHNPAGDVITQLPYTAGSYAAATAEIDQADFTFGGTTCTTS